MMSCLTKVVGGVPYGLPIVGASPAFAVTDGIPGVVTMLSSAFFSPEPHAVKEASERTVIANSDVLRSFISEPFG